MADDSYRGAYNPDVLSCLANLSNDEVFTPPTIVNAMLDMLPQELFLSLDSTFLDPVTKSGVFLREIAKRLIKGLENKIPDLQKRVDHIFHKQLYGIAITELTSLLSRRSVYCSKYPNSKYSVTSFENASGNVRFKSISHIWKNGKCAFCGASEKEYKRDESLETHAYELIHTVHPERIFDMKFDVIIGNPPYQLNDGGGINGISAKPIYHIFIEQAKRLNPRFLTMIIPARWYAGGKGLNDFRKNMLHDKHIINLIDYPKSRECFQGVDVAGGICYFLWDRDNVGKCKLISINGDKTTSRIRELDEFDIFVRDNTGIDIVHKIRSCHQSKYLSQIVFPRNSFGFTTSSRGVKEYFKDSIKLISSDGIGYINRNSVTKNHQFIDMFKVSIGTLNPDRGGVNNATDGKINVTTKVKILNPEEVVTETYIILNTFAKKDEAYNFSTYIKTKFVRFLISLTITSMHIVRENFQFVPAQDFSEPWTDEKLYEKYRLTDEEIASIESTIRPMNLSGGDDDA